VALNEASTSTALNPNKKRPLEATGDNSKQGTTSTAEGSNKAGDNTKKGPEPLKRDTKLMGRYLDYDLSKMVNSKGGFLVEDGADFDERAKQRTKERELQRKQQVHHPAMYIDKAMNPKCEKCDSTDIDQTFKQVFGCLVCGRCKKEDPERYSLLTKTECKDDYLLTDPELRDSEAMPHLLKANPHSSTWNNMMLFLRYQVEDFAFKKWGGPDGLDAEYERRTTEKRRKKNKKFEQGLRELRKKTREGIWQRRQDAIHQHEFDEPDVDEEGRGVQRCRGCGFEMEVEVF
jgi:DNA-repair protein complementing XP-A cells